MPKIFSLRGPHQGPAASGLCPEPSSSKNAHFFCTLTGARPDLRTTRCVARARGLSCTLGVDMSGVVSDDVRSGKPL